jgi:hypothetical protein
VLGWIFWAWKTEHDVATWSYRRGIAQEYIVADVRNSSLFVYPVLDSGCVDASYNYTAPATVSTYVPPDYTNSAAGANSSGSEGGSSNSKGGASGTKGGAPSVRRLGEMSWALISVAWAVAWWVWL